MKRSIKNGITVVVALIIAGGFTLYEGLKNRRGDVFERYEFDCGAATLRVTASYEFAYLLNFVPGAYYDFEIKQKNSSEWGHLYAQRCDDPVEIPTNQIKRLRNYVSIAYMSDFVMASKDGGKTWSIFDVRKSKYDGLIGKTLSILDVQTEANPWTMKVWKYGFEKHLIIEFHSDDFGETWKKYSVEPAV